VYKNRDRYETQEDLEDAMYWAINDCLSGVQFVSRNKSDVIEDIIRMEMKNMNRKNESVTTSSLKFKLVEGFTTVARSRKNLLTEALSTNVKVYDVEIDGPPDIGRKVIAFVDSHEEYTILTRQDKDEINNKNWGDKDSHRSSDGEYYAGSHGWIYSLGYSKYIYLDELDLIPQRHHDKVASEKQAGEQRKQELTKSLVKVYGDELGMRLATNCISVEKGGRRVELPHYFKYLLDTNMYASGLGGLYRVLEERFDSETAKQVIMLLPAVESCRNHLKYSIPVKNTDGVKWDTYLSYGYSAEISNGNLILTRLIDRDNLSELADTLSRYGKNPGLKAYDIRNTYQISESLDFRNTNGVRANSKNRTMLKENNTSIEVIFKDNDGGTRTRKLVRETVEEMIEALDTNVVDEEDVISVKGCSIEELFPNSK
jgi:hypothetical protein